MSNKYKFHNPITSTSPAARALLQTCATFKTRFKAILTMNSYKKYLKYYLTTQLFLIIVIGMSQSQKTTHDSIHKQFAMALSMLQQANVLLPADSLIINNEYKNVYNKYYNYTDSIFKNYSKNEYANFAVQRYINLSYSANDLSTLKQYHDSLFIFSTTYFDYVELDSKLSVKIAQCVTNSFEGAGIGNKNDLLQHVVQAIKKNITIVYGANAALEDQKNIINRYAAQYAGRGIISQAYILYKAFDSIYEAPIKQAIPVKFSSNYMVFDKTNKPVEKFNNLNSTKIIAFNQTTSSFDMVNLIIAARAINDINPSIDFILARDSATISNSTIKGIGKLLTGKLNYVTLNDTDREYFEQSPQFVVLKPVGNIAWYTNNPTKLINWIEAPAANDKMAKEKFRIELNNNRKHELEQALSNPDTTTKYNFVKGNINFLLKGYWPPNLDAHAEYSYFTKHKHIIDTTNCGMLTLNLLTNNQVIYTNNFINAQLTSVVITATADHKMMLRFGDDDNSTYNNLKVKMEEHIVRLQNYKAITADYVFRGSVFVEQMNKQKNICINQIDELIVKPNTDTIKALLQARYSLFKLQQALPIQQVSFDDFSYLMPTHNFNSILYNSSLYTQLIDAWLSYGKNDVGNAVDLLFRSSVWVPTEATSIVGNYVWKIMNMQGREDIMMQIDTSYLLGCTGNNLDIKKRIEGYKRMAAGNKAPNIDWTSNGIQMQLDKLEAEIILIVFWADWCEHCKNILPELYKHTQLDKTIKVVAVNIDDDASSSELGRKLMPGWFHVQATEMWNDKLVDEYNVFGTPTVYVLDGEMKIIDKGDGLYFN